MEGFAKSLIHVFSTNETLTTATINLN